MYITIIHYWGKLAPCFIQSGWPPVWVFFYSIIDCQHLQNRQNILAIKWNWQ